VVDSFGMRPRSPTAFILLTLAACVELPETDLEGPQVVAASLADPRSVEVSIWPLIELELSEPLDPDSVHAGSVALFAWEAVADCSLTPRCDAGSCERGRCMVTPLRESDRRALDRGELAPELGIPLALELLDGPQGPDSLLRIRPQRPLAAHARHTLIVGAALRDRSGAALADAWGVPRAFERDFVTAAIGSAGPEPTLLVPVPGERDVPTNLAALELRFSPPLPWPQPDATLWLVDEQGTRTSLIDPQPCAGWLPGTCVRMRASQPLAPGRRHRVEGGTLVDRLGRSATPIGPTREAWFESAAGPDLDAAQVEVVAELRERCVIAWVAADEPLDASLIVEGETRRAALPPGLAAIGVAAHAQAPGEAIAWTLELRDRADNLARHEGELSAGSSFTPTLPRVAFTEILANPLGPEPDAEFVEIVALAELDTAGLLLSDRTPTQLHEAWLAGEQPPGDPLPAVALAAGELALIVGSSYVPGLAGDGAPPADARLLVVESSLASGGLANAGEPLTLWRAGASGPEIVARYGNWIDTSAKAHGGRSLVAAPDACDLPDRWRSHPLGRASPGRLP
jgi:hypothetical protein